MAKVLTTNELIETVLRRAMIPSNQVTFSNADIIDMLNEEMNIHILPVVLKTHEEYYTYSDTVTLENDKSRYEIPYRSIGNKLRDLHYKNSAGELYEMTRISPNNRSDHQSYYTTGFYNGYESKEGPATAVVASDTLKMFRIDQEFTAWKITIDIGIIISVWYAADSGLFLCMKQDWVVSLVWYNITKAEIAQTPQGYIGPYLSQSSHPNSSRLASNTLITV